MAKRAPPVSESPCDPGTNHVSLDAHPRPLDPPLGLSPPRLPGSAVELGTHQGIVEVSEGDHWAVSTTLIINIVSPINPALCPQNELLAISQCAWHAVKRNSQVSNSSRDTSKEMSHPTVKIPTFLNIYKS